MKNIYAFIFIVLIGLGCAKERTLEPLEKNTTPPGKVTNVQWKPGPGNAVITYALPSDQDLLYVKAVYKLATGRAMEVRASYYINTLTIEGFGDTGEHEVTLYAVNRSEVQSAPVVVKVKPLENPIWDVFRSLSIEADFSGVRIKATNETSADLAFEVFAADSTGVLKPAVRNIYTSSKDVNTTVRGYDSIPRNFAVTIRDRWLNYSDTMHINLTPLYETALPKSGYKEVKLPGDVGMYPGTSIAGMWDGDIDGWPRVMMTAWDVSTPQWVTFDIGKLATLSRIVIWDYPEYINGRTYYYGGCMKDFEIWGSANPNPGGSWDSWEKLGSFISVKPSGLPYGTNTSEDNAVGKAGLNYNFEIGKSKVRYLRIKNNKNWLGTTYIAIGEIQVYGDPR